MASADRLLEEVANGARRHNLFLAITAHAYNPDGMRGADNDWAWARRRHAPEATHVYVPAGGGGLLVAVARGLRQRAHAARVVACQPAGCAPIVSYLAGQIEGAPHRSCDRTAIPAPPTAVATGRGQCRRRCHGIGRMGHGCRLTARSWRPSSCS